MHTLYSKRLHMESSYQMQHDAACYCWTIWADWPWYYFLKFGAEVPGIFGNTWTQPWNLRWLVSYPKKLSLCRRLTWVQHVRIYLHIFYSVLRTVTLEHVLATSFYSHSQPINEAAKSAWGDPSHCSDTSEKEIMRMSAGDAIKSFPCLISEFGMCRAEVDGQHVYVSSVLEAVESRSKHLHRHTRSWRALWSLCEYSPGRLNSSSAISRDWCYC